MTKRALNMQNKYWKIT